MAFFHALEKILAVADDTGLDHLPKEIITFPGTFTDTSENRETVVFLSDVINKLLDKDCLTDSSATEKTDLPALKIRLKKVDHLDSGVKDFL